MPSIWVSKRAIPKIRNSLSFFVAVLISVSYSQHSIVASDAQPVPAPVAMELTSVPDVPNKIATEVARYQNVRSAAVVDWVGDSLLIVTRFGDTSQLHLVRSPLGMREQITFAEEPIGGALVPPIAAA